jgi:hypothetical protein
MAVERTVENAWRCRGAALERPPAQGSATDVNVGGEIETCPIG